MDPLTIVALVEAALAAAPKAIEIATKGKELVAALFTANLITKAQQDALHARIDASQSLALSGIVPAHWQVQPDPQ